jgi:penicillin-insensitive murein endopeptidase
MRRRVTEPRILATPTRAPRRAGIATAVRFGAAVAAALSTGGCVHTAMHSPLVDTTRGLSVGSPSFGFLLQGVRIPDRGAGYELFRSRAAGGQAYGTARLVEAIEGAARYVRRHTTAGAPLRVGDLSAPHGGRIEHHNSHRNGRDVDLLFFALDAAGASVPTPAFVRYDAAGVSVDPAFPLLRFDVARNWYLVEALARDEDAGVNRIFCATHLHPLLLGYARAHGRDAAVVARAELLLRQPGDSAPHDDHFHVRVACSPDERAQGCRDGGPMWWWLEKDWDKGESASADDETLLDALADLGPVPAASIELASSVPNPPEERPVAACIPSLVDLRRAPAHRGEAAPVDAASDPGASRGTACGR